MNEIVMSDLEEGEILDSPPSPSVSVKKNRDLPKRYVIRENKNVIHKHKKDCKYAIRYHAKKLSKLKKTPNKIKDTHKKHHKSTCSREKSHKVPDKCNGSAISKHLLSKNGHSFSQHSLIAEMKNSLKIIVDKQDIKPSESKSEKCHLETKDVKTPKKDNTSETVTIFKENEFQLENNSVSDSKYHDEPLKKDINELPDLMNPSVDNVERNVNNISSNCSEAAKNEESEDEDVEELRRIALATRAKRKNTEFDETVIQNVDDIYNVPVSESSENNVHISYHETSNVASDNYEVVDMEVDDDIESPLELIETSVKNPNSECSENLFVIDTNPSSDIVENKADSFSESPLANNSTDEEFEVDILRAELLSSLYSKKDNKNEQLPVQKSNVNLTERQIPVLPKTIQNQVPAFSGKKHLKYRKPNVNFHHRTLQSPRRFLRKNTVNKSGTLKCNISKAAVEANKPAERIVINLHEESSSEDSDNPVDSIVALISDCRQKSDSNEKISEDAEHVPKAVSCLSKAQQQEYNSLKKILAEKKKLPNSQDTFQQKNGGIHSPLNDLKQQLEGKLVSLQDALKTKKESETSLTKEVNSKKLQYMKAKLSAQHLKEQYIAAEKVRKAKLMEWSNSCNHLKNLKQNISDLERKVGEVQNLYSKIGSSIQGQSYSLPSSNKQS